MLMKKEISLIMAFAFVLCLLTGCGGDSQTNDGDNNTTSGLNSNTSSNASTDTASKDGSNTASDLTGSETQSNNQHTSSTGEITGVSINGVSLDKFKVVWPRYNVSYITKLQIDELIKTAEDKYSYKLESSDENDYNEYEILIGVYREGTVIPEDPDAYTISISGKKVFLNGGSIQATAMAVSEFTKLLQKKSLTDADSVLGSHRVAIAGYDTSKYFTYAWGDDFNGNTIDTTKWYIAPEGKFDSDGMNGRKSIRTDDPNYVFLSGGKFYIRAGYTKDKYIGGMMMSHRHMLYRYGYLEMSAILPHGDGFWTALWLDTRGHTFWPPPEQEAGKLYDAEIDVNECFGNAATVASNVHKWPTELGSSQGHKHTSLDTPQYGNDKKHSLEGGATFGEGFHTFGLLWDEDEHTFVCDGEVYFTYKNNTTPEDRDGLHALSFIRLSAAIGYESLGTVAADDDPAWTTSNELVVDYVHIYQLNDGKSKLLTQ